MRIKILGYKLEKREKKTIPKIEKGQIKMFPNLMPQVETWRKSTTYIRETLCLYATEILQKKKKRKNKAQVTHPRR